MSNTTFAKEYYQYNKAKLAQSMYSNHVLKNKLGIHDAKKLAQIEFLGSAKRMNAILKSHQPICDISQLCSVHLFLFGFLYSWAGKIRDYDISKNNHSFLPYSVMVNAGMYVDRLIKKINNKEKPSIKDYANLLDNINQMHPFREGNGRSAKAFIQLIAIGHGQFIQYHADESQAIKGLNSGNIDLVVKNMKLEKYNHSLKQRLHFVIVNEQQQGWEVNNKDAKELKLSDKQPSKKIKKEARQFVKNMKDYAFGRM